MSGSLKLFVMGTIALLCAACSMSAGPGFSESELATALAAESASRTQEAGSQVSATASNTPLLEATTTASTTEIALTAPHEDGIYLVGSEIAAGSWRSISKEEGRFCYWARRKYDGVVLGSYYGLPGGDMLIRESDYEVELDGCGVWVYVGE